MDQKRMKQIQISEIVHILYRPGKFHPLIRIQFFLKQICVSRNHLICAKQTPHKHSSKIMIPLYAYFNFQ